MNEFRHHELISFTDFFFILLVTVILLSFAYFFLKKIQPTLKKNLNKKNTQNIDVIAHRNISVLGEVFVISVDDEKFLVIKTKTGLTTTPLNGRRLDTELLQPDIEIS